jgi:hypothetical protein
LFQQVQLGRTVTRDGVWRGDHMPDSGAERQIATGSKTSLE